MARVAIPVKTQVGLEDDLNVQLNAVDTEEDSRPISSTRVGKIFTDGHFSRS